MKNPDDAVERVLRGLQETEAPLGMEQRILEAAPMRLAQRRRWIVLTPATFTGMRPWAIAAASLVVIALATSITLHRRHPAGHPEAQIRTTKPLEASSAPTPQVEEAATSGHPLATTEPRQSSRVEKAATVSDEDVLALSQMNAPSQPAPPMPLTGQEKLLVKLIHRGDPVELAMLDPQVRSSELADSKAEFEAFFAPPKAIDKKPNDDSKSIKGEN